METSQNNKTEGSEWQPCDTVHNLPRSEPHQGGGESRPESGQLATRLKAVRELMDTLRESLSIVKSELAIEKAQTLWLNESTMISDENYVDNNQCGNFPYFQNCENLTINQNNVPFARVYNNPGDYSGHFYYPFVPNPYLISEDYRERLFTIDEMCQEELHRVQESISSLEKVKQYVSTNMSEHGSSCSEPGDKPRYRQRPKEHRRTAKLKLATTIPTKQRGHSNRYCQFKELPSEKKYIRDCRDLLNELDEFSAASAKTSASRCSPDSTSNSDTES